MPRRFVLASLAACVLAVGEDVSAQPPNSGAPAQLDLAGEVDLVRLVDLAAQRLRLNIDYDAAALKGGVTLRLESEITDDELWLLVNRVLAARGFTTIRAQGASGYSVVKLADAAAIAAQSPALQAEVQGPEGRVPQPGFTSTVVQARHRGAKELADQINKVMSRGGGAQGAASNTVSVVGDTGLLLITDVQPRVDRVLDLLKVLDIPGAQTVVRDVSLEHLSAVQMATLLTQIGAKQEAVSGEKLAGDVVAAPDGNRLLVVAQEARQDQWLELIRSLDREEEVVTATYTPRYFAADDVANLIQETIQPEQAGAGRAGASWRLVVDPLTASLVITASPARHTEIERLLARLDSVPAATRRPVRSFVIKNRSVNEIRSILEELLSAGVLDTGAEAVIGIGSGTVVDNSAVSISDGAGTSPSAAQAAGAGGDAPSEVASLPPPPINVRPPGREGSRLQSRPLGRDSSGRLHGSSRSAAPLLSGLSESRDRFARSSGSPLVLTVDEGTNTLIAIGEPRLLAQAEALLKTLDVRQPQVMLEVVMVTISDDQTISLGAELEELRIDDDLRIRLSSLFGLGTRSSGGDRDGPLNASGFTGVVLSPGDFSVVVRALETLNKGRSLSRPRLLVGNNQQASINSVVQQPFASVNASNTVSTTSFGGTQDAGTVVTIRPQIAEGDHMVLDYSVSLSSFVGAAADPSLPPPRQENQVQSIATIPDGYTVVVGGIEIENRSRSVSQIPFVGNIPVIGEVFKSRAGSRSNSRFYVFIRANILRGRGAGGEASFEDLKYLSSKDSRAAGIGDGWPEVRPRVIR